MTLTLITDIAISDAGTLVLAAYNHRTQALNVRQYGGCPVEEKLAGIDFTLGAQDLANAILLRWLEGYEGDPHEASLSVEVARNGKRVMARPTE